MYQQVTEHDFIDAFRQFDRLDTGTGGNFTPAGCRALFDYLTEIETGAGDTASETFIGMRLDVIALCVDFAEYADAMDAIREHLDAAERADLFSDCSDGDEIRETILDWFHDQTTVIEVDGGGIIVQAF